jgi:hypothetical protein
MRTGRGRTIALLSALAGLASVAAAAVVGKEAFVERYYLLRLGSADEAVRLEAADELAEMKSLAAVPHLMRIIMSDERENVVFYAETSASGYQFYRREWIGLTPMAHALFRIGAGALLQLDAQPDCACKGSCSKGQPCGANHRVWLLVAEIRDALRAGRTAEQQPYGSMESNSDEQVLR